MITLKPKFILAGFASYDNYPCSMTPLASGWERIQGLVAWGVLCVGTSTKAKLSTDQRQRRARPWWLVLDLVSTTSYGAIGFATLPLTWKP
jgi:hypothetical protein